MTQDFCRALAHVLWIGGATDAGKTTVASMLGERHGFQVYHYDQRDLPHHERLAETNLHYRRFLDASMEERWVHPEPADLLDRSLRSFRDRLPMVVEDLQALPAKPAIVAEGFGLTPALIAPLLSSPQQAIWLVPTEAFKWASMKRRGKFTRRLEMSDPQRAIDNLFRRDLMLAQQVVEQARARDLTVVEVDDTRSPEAMAALVEAHFAPYLQLLGLS